MTRLLIFLVLLGWQGPAAPRWTPQQTGVSVRLRGVSAVSTQVAWASGADGTVLRTSNGGASWERLASPATVMASAFAGELASWAQLQARYPG